jgi:hypothetical protein
MGRTPTRRPVGTSRPRATSPRSEDASSPTITRSGTRPVATQGGI